MTGTTKILSAAMAALSLILFAGQANAQFGPMGGGMMGMGMRGGPMGMMRGGPGMGSSRYMMMDGGGSGSSRRSRSRDYYEEAPSRHTKAHSKPAYVAPPAPRVTTAAPAAPVQANAVPTTQVGAVQQTQAPQPVKPAATVQPQVSATTVSSAAPEADADSNVPTRLTPETRPRNCTTKLHLKDGTVILQDFCTLEQAVIKQGNSSQTLVQAPAQPAAPVAQPANRQAPAQVARNR